MKTTKTPHSIKSPHYPDFIRDNLIFKVYPTPEKIFPKIGLNNSKQGLPKTFTVSSANYFFALIVSYLTSARNQISSHSCYGESDAKLKTEVLNDYKRLLELIKDRAKCLIVKNGSISFIVPNDFNIAGASVSRSFSKDSNLFDLIEHLSSKWTTSIPIHCLRKLHSKFLSIPQNAKIVFSSDSNKGFWDIATMSMRGITSCQRWTSKNHKTKLLGSMLDPYAGIIYLETNKNTQYGSKMVRRSIVRFVLNKETNKPALFLERVYPVDYDYERYIDHTTIETFANFLRKKTNGKFEIICASTDSVSKYIVPFSEQTLDIYNNLGKKYLSYRDSGIKYSHVKSYKNISKVKI